MPGILSGTFAPITGKSIWWLILPLKNEISSTRTTDRWFEVSLRLTIEQWALMVNSKPLVTLLVLRKGNYHEPEFFSRDLMWLLLPFSFSRFNMREWLHSNIFRETAVKSPIFPPLDAKITTKIGKTPLDASELDSTFHCRTKVLNVPKNIWCEYSTHFIRYRISTWLVTCDYRTLGSGPNHQWSEGPYWAVTAMHIVVPDDIRNELEGASSHDVCFEIYS